MTTINYNISVQQCSKGQVRIVSISNGPQCTTCLNLANGDSISIDTRDYEKDMVPVSTIKSDYIVRITREVA